MYCKFCGKEINDKSVVCPHCGCQVGEIKSDVENARPTTEKVNGMSIAGFILACISFLITLYGTVATVGLVLCIIGMKQCDENGEKLKGLAIAGIIISTVSLVLTTLLLIIGVSLLI